jgi:hypothetical protein
MKILISLLIGSFCLAAPPVKKVVKFSNICKTASKGLKKDQALKLNAAKKKYGCK